MKILFTFGGITPYMIALLNKINDKPDTEVVIVVPHTPQTIGKGVKLTEEGKNFRTLYAQTHKVCGKLYFKNFLALLKEEQPDLIVVGWPFIVGLSVDFRTLLYLKSKKIGIILREIPFMVAPYNQALSYYRKHPIVDEDLNNITPKGWKFLPWAIGFKYFRKWYYSFIDATLAYAESAYTVETSYGVKKEQIFVTLNSPDTDNLFEVKKELSGQDLPEYNPYRLIHVGRLVKWKSVDILIEAFARLKPLFPQAELIIVGKGPEEENLKKQADSLQVADSVIFKGGIYNYMNLGPLLMSSGIYVLAGMGGLSINEAMAFGKPVVCSVADGTERTLVREGYNGMYFEDRNADSLFRVLQQLLSNPVQIKTMGEHSGKIIREEINLDTVSQRFMDAFHYVSNKKNRG